MHNNDSLRYLGREWKFRKLRLRNFPISDLPQAIRPRRLGDHEIPVRAACLYGDPITREEVLGAPSSHQMRMGRWGTGYDAEASRRGDSGIIFAGLLARLSFGLEDQLDNRQRSADRAQRRICG